MSAKSCFFTGHREFTIDDNPAVADHFKYVLSDCVENGITDFYTGGAYGWDAFCALSVIIMKKHAPHVRLHLVLPCPPEQQTLKWSDSQKAEYDMILEFADDVEIVSKEYTKDCMKKRNARLVELGDMCVCYFNQKDSRSGTGQTVRMAEKAGKTVINLYR